MSKFDQDIRKKGKVMEDFENELKPEPKPKSSGTKSAKPRPKPESSIKTTDVTDVILLKDETTRKIFGILLICFSLFSLASLVSSVNETVSFTKSRTRLLGFKDSQGETLP